MGRSDRLLSSVKAVDGVVSNSGIKNLFKALTDDQKEKKRLGTNKKQDNFFSNFQKFTGIRVTTANILRQSQVLNRYVGSIFQIFGSIVDIFLAPILGALSPLLPALTGLYPIMQQVGDFIARFDY